MYDPCKTYKTVKIGYQTWMAENLAYKTKRGSWAYDKYENDVKTYGRLYNHETAKYVCPDNWRLPTKSDFETLLDKYGGEGETAYRALKERGSSGFNAIIAGRRDNDNRFEDKGVYTFFWSYSSSSSSNGWSLRISDNRNDTYMEYNEKKCGFSVRCIKEN